MEGESSPEEAQEEQPPKTLDAWLMLKQAELMLEHLAASPAQWPQNALYCHACITALRSVTLVLQRALAHEPGFDDWYAGVQEQFRSDPELAYRTDREGRGEAHCR